MPKEDISKQVDALKKELLGAVKDFEKLDKLLNKDEVDPKYKGAREIVLKDLGFLRGELFLAAVEGGGLKAVERLLRLPSVRLGSAGGENAALKKAVKANRKNVVILLLKQKSILDAFPKNIEGILDIISSDTDPRIIEELLKVYENKVDIIGKIDALVSKVVGYEDFNKMDKSDEKMLVLINLVLNSEEYGNKKELIDNVLNRIMKEADHNLPSLDKWLEFPVFRKIITKKAFEDADNPTGSKNLLIYLLGSDSVKDKLDNNITISLKCGDEQMEGSPFAMAVVVALKRNSPDLLKTILESPKYQNELSSSEGMKAFTKDLLIFAKSGYLEVVSLLLMAKKQDPENAKNVLKVALRAGQEQLAVTLLNRKEIRDKFSSKDIKEILRVAANAIQGEEATEESKSAGRQLIKTLLNYKEITSKFSEEDIIEILLLNFNKEELVSELLNNEEVIDKITPKGVHKLLRASHRDPKFIKFLFSLKGVEKYASDKMVSKELFNAAFVLIGNELPIKEQERMEFFDPENFNVKNEYGMTLLNYAAMTGDFQLAKMLKPDLTEKQFYDLVPIDQGVLNSKMQQYLDAMIQKNYPWKTEDIINLKGHCNAWSFIWAHYVSLGKEDKFIAIKQAIATADRHNLKKMNLPSTIQRKYPYKNQEELWNQFLQEKTWFKDVLDAIKNNRGRYKEEYIEKTEALFSKFKQKKEASRELYKSLKEEYDEYKKLSSDEKEKHPMKDMFEDLFSEKYNDRIDVFEEIIPVAAIFQATVKASKEIFTEPRGLGQHIRSEQAQIGLSQSAVPLAEMTQLGFEEDAIDKKAKIVKMLTLYAQFPGIYVDTSYFGDKTGHNVGFSVVHENGEILYKFYDSNSKFDLLHPEKGVNVFKSLEEIADKILLGCFKEVTKINFRPFKFEKLLITFEPNFELQKSLASTPELVIQKEIMIRIFENQYPNLVKNIDEPDNKGNTLLFYAVQLNDKNWMMELLSKGANPKKLCQNGESPWSIASEETRKLFDLIEGVVDIEYDSDPSSISLLDQLLNSEHFGDKKEFRDKILNRIMKESNNNLPSLNQWLKFPGFRKAIVKKAFEYADSPTGNKDFLIYLLKNELTKDILANNRDNITITLQQSSGKQLKASPLYIAGVIACKQNNPTLLKIVLEFPEYQSIFSGEPGKNVFTKNLLTVAKNGSIEVASLLLMVDNQDPKNIDEVLKVLIEVEKTGQRNLINALLSNGDLSETKLKEIKSKLEILRAKLQQEPGKPIIPAAAISREQRGKAEPQKAVEAMPKGKEERHRQSGPDHH